MKTKLIFFLIGISLTSISFAATNYVEGTKYNAGDKVRINNGNIYQCKEWPYTSWCGGVAWAYAPNAGTYWKNAWTLISNGETGANNAGSNSGTLNYHTTFPVTENSTTMEKIDISQEKYTKLILPNIVAGVMLEHMMSDNFPKRFENNKDYLIGSLFAQLLQENISTKNYTGGDYINIGSAQESLLNSGQGGPYQLNDYSKRLPDVGINGAKGLINYKVLQASLGFTILDQDSGMQTASKGPKSLDSVYFGAIAATYFHYNDLNRMEVNNSTSYGPQQSWGQCKINLKKGLFPVDQILDAAYNAGTYSNILLTLVDVCAYSDQQGMPAYISDFSNLSLNDSDFINRFQFGDLNAGVNNIPAALPGYYAGTTYILYPRQVRYYVDQLAGNNAQLNKYSLSTDISFNFTQAELRTAFVKSMQTLGDVDENNTYNFISSNDALNAFNHSVAANNSQDAWSFSDEANRKEVYKIVLDSLVNLENKLGFKFNASTEIDFVLGEVIKNNSNTSGDNKIIKNCGETPAVISEWEQRLWWDPSVNGATNYKVNDFVSYNRSVWKALNGNINKPDTNSWDWKKCN